MAQSTSTKLTYEDYAEIPNDGRRYEIIDGELYVNPAPATKHQAAVGNTYALLWMYMRAHHTGRVFVAPYDVILSDHDVVQPDVLWIAAEHSSLVANRGLEGAPDLAVEVLSPSSVKLDEKIKHTRYAFFGVPEYWIVDPEREHVRVFRLRDRELQLVAELSGNDTITSPVLPGFSITAFEIFHAHEA
jgi:Uma2 family endonuclease